MLIKTVVNESRIQDCRSMSQSTDELLSPDDMWGGEMCAIAGIADQEDAEFA